jgi:hypothetical protein
MGQYYRFIFLSETGEIVHWINSYGFRVSKMMEFAWQSADTRGLVEAAEAVLAGSIESNQRYRVVCAGDYGAPEPKAPCDRKRDLETVLTAVKTVAGYGLCGIDPKQAERFLDISPLDYGHEDRDFVEKCLNAWYKYNDDKNLYHMCDDLPKLQIKPKPVDNTLYPYIVNHTRKEFVDKRKNKAYNKMTAIFEHPLPLLVCETATGGGGDYSGERECDVGIWARDVITMEHQHPGDEYNEFVVGFREC